MYAQTRPDIEPGTIPDENCKISDLTVMALATDETQVLRRAGVVKWHLDSNGIPSQARKRKLSSEQVADALRSYGAGEVLHSIASRLGVDEGAVMHHVKRNGLRLRGRTGAPPKYTGNETHLHCLKCQQNLPLEEFGKKSNPRCKRPRSALCKKCARERKTCKEYDISPERYRELQSAPRCAICGISFETSKRFIDHCHLTGRIRGVVCEFCNSGLGFSHDSTTRLQQLKNYLSREVLIPATAHAGIIGDAVKQRRVRVYNIYPDQYTWLLELCANTCHCCGAPFEEHRRKAPNIDHCHSKGHVRGLLCFACNIAVGKFRNSADVIDAAIAYLGGTS